MINTTKIVKALVQRGNIIFNENRSFVAKSSSTINGVYKRFKSSCYCDGENADYDMTSAFTHTQELGYIRESAVAPVILPNERIDQYVWKDISKWQNQTALV